MHMSIYIPEEYLFPVSEPRREDYSHISGSDYVLFWGHTGKIGAPLGTECFSQWWLSLFSDGENLYCCAEQYMMAQKALLFGDRQTFSQIMQSTNPAEMKALGRMVKPFDNDEWKKHRYACVLRGTFLKFSQCEEARAVLLATGERLIAEASPRDRIWGIGMGRENPLAHDTSTWRGSNLLGFALMQVRERIAKEQDKKA